MTHPDPIVIIKPCPNLQPRDNIVICHPLSSLGCLLERVRQYLFLPQLASPSGLAHLGAAQ